MRKGILSAVHLFFPSRGPPASAAQGGFLLPLRAFENVAFRNYAACIRLHQLANHGALPVTC
jgi:hypothetical protein